jgi:phytoene dehydrogenase-like protein
LPTKLAHMTVGIVGAGVAGLVCAQDLTRAGVECTVLEAADHIGGRVSTDVVDGFLLDRGFQILLTAYPQVRKRVALDRLQPGYFEPGARVMTGGQLRTLSDPLRRPLSLPATLSSPVGTLADKLRTARLVLDVLAHRAPDLLRRPEMTTAARLAAAGFSAPFIAGFWQPLFAGIQLDPELQVSSRRFDVVLRMLATGRTCLPHEGMGAVPAQLAATLPSGTVRLGRSVVAVEPGAMVVDDGERVAAKAVVVATDGPTAHHLLGERVPDPGSRAAACCWFSAPSAPVPGGYLMLEGDGGGPALNVVVMSEVQPSYAPAGQALLAAAVPGPQASSPGLASRVSEQLARWFGGYRGDLAHLRTDVIAHGQPLQSPPTHPRRRVSLGDGLFVCGDHRDTASLQGAMFSGERAAGAVMAFLGTGSSLGKAP